MGLLSESSPVRLFLNAEESAFTGMVGLTREQQKRTYLFEQGKPIFSRSNVEDEYLGALLVQHGKITNEQCGEVLRKMSETPNTQFGEMLLSLGLLDLNGISQILQEQLRLRMEKVLDWRDGRFVLLSKLPEKTSRVGFEGTVAEVCFRGLVGKHIERPETQNLKATSVPIVGGGQKTGISSLRLVGKEMAFFRAMNGVMGIGEILARTSLDPALGRAMILAFQDLGLVRIDERPDKEEEEPKKEEAPRLPDASVKLMAEVSQRLEAAKAQNLFEIMGVTRKASIEEIKNTYLGFARRLHLDRLPKELSPDDRKRAEELFARITDANTQLTNPASRKAYEESMDSALSQGEARKAVESEIEYQTGLAALRKGNFVGAVEGFRSAIKLYDKEGEYWVYLGWAVFREATRRKDSPAVVKSKHLIEKGMQMNPKLSESHYFLGMISKSEGDLETAKRHFKQTLEIAPKHMEAASELRVLNMRAEKEKAHPGMSSLFRKAKP